MTETLSSEDAVMQWAWDNTNIKSASSPWSSEELDYWGLIAWCLEETNLAIPFELLTETQQGNYALLLKGLKNERIQERKNDLDGFWSLGLFLS